MADVCHTCGIVVKLKVRHWCGMSRDDLHFRLRIPPDLKDRVQSAAETNKRSMTAEIVATLEEKYPHPLAPTWMLIDSLLGLTKEQREAVVKIFEDAAKQSDDPGLAEYTEAVRRLHLALGDKKADGPYRDYVLRELKKRNRAPD